MLYEYQFGFRKGWGPEEVVVKVINNICKGLDGCNGITGILYDFSKALDLVEHKILIEKLAYYGVEREAIKLLESYLTNRKQYVEINNQKSSVETVQYGFPQEPVLGALFFSVYINDIKRLQLFGKLVMFADDINVFYPYKCETVLKAHMEYDTAMITKYARINRLSLNAGKTKILRFRPNAVINKNFSTYVDGKVVEESFDTKYLAVNL